MAGNKLLLPIGPVVGLITSVEWGAVSLLFQITTRGVQDENLRRRQDVQVNSSPLRVLR